MQMQWYEYAMWGLAGGVMIDGMEMIRIIRENHGRLPAEFRTPWAIFSMVLRTGIGSGLTTILGLSTDNINTPLTAASVGIAAPAILEKLSKTVPRLPER